MTGSLKNNLFCFIQKDIRDTPEIKMTGLLLFRQNFSVLSRYTQRVTET